MGFGVWGLGLVGLGFGVWVEGFGVSFSILDLDFRAQGL